MELDDDLMCFVCGPENQGGLRLEFQLDRESRSLSADFTPAKTWQGYKDVVHGGIISTVLDEAMTKLAYSLGINVVTGKLTVRFKRPLLIGEKVRVTGRIIKESGRTVEAAAEAVKEDGTVVAEAEGLLVRIK
ncbi:MAG: PaaI family thioesterase [Nitrospirota bacterium]